jgi:hypothetical protein
MDGAARNPDCADMREHIIHLHPRAPAKPAEGRPCNGCGVCCAAAPCPLGMVLTRRMRGPCRLLRWDDTAAQYRCGALLSAPAATKRLVRRWIGAAAGCDSDLDARSADGR